MGNSHEKETGHGEGGKGRDDGLMRWLYKSSNGYFTQVARCIGVASCNEWSQLIVDGG